VIARIVLVRLDGLVHENVTDLTAYVSLTDRNDPSVEYKFMLFQQPTQDLGDPYRGSQNFSAAGTKYAFYPEQRASGEPTVEDALRSLAPDEDLRPDVYVAASSDERPNSGDSLNLTRPEPNRFLSQDDVFAGLDPAQYTWNLVIADGNEREVGTLTGWNIELELEVVPVPEPTVLSGLALAGLLGARRRRQS
jgi:hypothetical protein